MGPVSSVRCSVKFIWEIPVNRAQLLILLLLFAGHCSLSAAGESEWPVELRSYAALATKCAENAPSLRSRGWQTIYRETFDKPAVVDPAAKPTWCLGPNSAASAAELMSYDGRSVVRMTTPPETEGLIQAGPKVKGEFAMEFVGRTDAERPCDLSLFSFIPGRGGVAFQFGGSYNQYSSIWTNKAAEDGSRPVLKDTEIKPGKWYHVRLELRGDTLTAVLDGRPLGTAPVDREALGDFEHQACIYTWGTTIYVDECIVQVPGMDEGQLAEAERKEFSEYQAAIDQLIVLLDDEHYAVREGATKLLTSFGSMAAAKLQAIAKEGTPEQRFRAKKVLEEMGAAAKSSR